MSNQLTLILFALGLSVIVISQSLFTVDETEKAIVLQLGQPVGDVREAGLHFKIPLIQDVRTFDSRILSVDPAPEEMVIASSLTIRDRSADLTTATATAEVPVANTETPAEDGNAETTDTASEDATSETAEATAPTAASVPPPITNVSGEPIIVDSYARYRISDPLQFLKTLRNVDNANKRVESIIDEATRTVLGKTTLKELLSSDRTRVMAEINARLKQKIAEDKLGIEIVDVRIVRADLGESLRDSTVRRMVSEMNERATETRAKGEELATAIRAKADKDRTIILAEAEKNAQIFRGEGDSEAIQTYANAFNKDKEFYSFMRSMEAYRNTLADPETRMILSPNSEFFKYFENR